MADVFISYSQKAPEPTVQLAAELTACGLSCWYDVNLEATEVFWKVIMQRITDAKAVVTIWSKPALESEWVYAETMLAHRLKKLVCTHTPDIAPEQVPLPFNGFNVCRCGYFGKIESALRTFGLDVGRTAPNSRVVLQQATSAVETRPPTEVELRALSVALEMIKGSDDPTDFEDLLSTYGHLNHLLVRQARKRFDLLVIGRSAAVGSTSIATEAPLPLVPAPIPQAEVAAAESDIFLRIEAGMHTAVINRVGVSADGRWIATGSDDKTVRLWEVTAGGKGLRLARVLRLPIVPGDDGKVYAVALAPDASWVAAGGWTTSGAHFITILDTTSGRVLARLGPLPNVILDLAVTADGRRLAAGLGGSNGIRVWSAGDAGGAAWSEAFADRDYGGQVYGLAFLADGGLVSTSYDGAIRRYDTEGKLAQRATAPGGKRPFAIAVHSDGARLAVGYRHTTAVDVLDTQSLARLYAADTGGISGGDLSSVAWSVDGARLYAGGRSGGRPDRLYVWDGAGKGKRRTLPGPQSTVFDLAPLPLPGGDGLAFVASDPAIGLLDAAGSRLAFLGPLLADLRGKRYEHFTVHPDGRRLRFGLKIRSEDPHVLDLADFALRPAPQPIPGLAAADTKSLAVENWEDETEPTLAGKRLELEQYETSRSLAVLPGKAGLILGTEWSLRRYDATGKPVWQQPVPGVVWGVNLARDGNLIIAAYGDGTIRWHRASDGVELLAVFIGLGSGSASGATSGSDPEGLTPLHPRPMGSDPQGLTPVEGAAKRLIAWTPKGYYQASPGAEDLIGWHVNRGPDEAPDWYPASTFRDTFNRPDIVQAAIAPDKL